MIDATQEAMSSLRILIDDIDCNGDITCERRLEEARTRLNNIDEKMFIKSNDLVLDEQTLMRQAELLNALVAELQSILNDLRFFFPFPAFSSLLELGGLIDNIVDIGFIDVRDEIRERFGELDEDIIFDSSVEEEKPAPVRPKR